MMMAFCPSQLHRGETPRAPHTRVPDGRTAGFSLVVAPGSQGLMLPATTSPSSSALSGIAALALVLGAPSLAAAGTTGSPTPLPTTRVAAFDAGNAAADLLGIDRSPVRGAIDRAMSPSGSTCGPTEFTAYVGGLVAGLSADERALMARYPMMLDIPTFDAILFGSDADPRYSLRLDYAQPIRKTFRGLQRFWDIPSQNIHLMAMHGDVLQDPQRVARVLQLPLPGFGLSPSAAQAAARDISTAMQRGMLTGGNNPLLTLNAFAFTPKLYPNPLMQGLPDKIIVGDGMIDTLNALGVGDVGPQAVLAHEFGHHVQFRDGIYASALPPPEASRRVELMADAFSTYFTVHARGLSLNTKRVLEAERTFFDLGDCAYTNSSHHGTPLQRMRSATWAADVVTAAHPQGHILPSLTFDARFESELPVLVTPDAS